MVGRTTLNLTPLLDLLLILVFASLLHTWTVSAQTSSRQKQKLSNAEQSALAARSEARALKQRLVQLRTQLAAAEELSQRLSQYEMRFTQAVQLLIELARTDALDERQREALSELTDELSSAPTHRERMALVRSAMSVFEVRLVSSNKAIVTYADKKTEVLFDEEMPSARQFAGSISDLGDSREVAIVFFSYGDVLVSVRDRLREVLERSVSGPLMDELELKAAYLLETGYDGR